MNPDYCEVTCPPDIYESKDCAGCGAHTDVKGLYPCMACHEGFCIHCTDAFVRVPDLLIEGETITLCPACMERYEQYKDTKGDTMARESVIAKNLRERIARKEHDLIEAQEQMRLLDLKIDTLNGAIIEDRDLLANAQPKQKRTPPKKETT